MITVIINEVCLGRRWWVVGCRYLTTAPGVRKEDHLLLRPVIRGVRRVSRIRSESPPLPWTGPKVANHNNVPVLQVRARPATITRHYKFQLPSDAYKLSLSLSSPLSLSLLGEKRVNRFISLPSLLHCRFMDGRRPCLGREKEKEEGGGVEWRPDTWNNTGIVYGCKSDGDVTRRCVDGFFFSFRLFPVAK